MASIPNEVYRAFWLSSLPFEHPTRFGYDWFAQAVSNVWDAKSRQTDWLGFEHFTRDCLASPALTDDQKVRILKEAVGAFTGRGAVE